MNFEQLIKKFGTKLKSIAYKLDGKYTAFNHDDLYQEALFYLWQKFQEGEFKDCTDSYILQNCFYFLKNYIRKAFKKMDASSVSLEEMVNDDLRLEDILESPKISELLEGELEIKINNLLDERERQVLQFNLEGLTTRQIGERVGVSHVMVIKIGNRIKEKCKEFIAELN